MLGHCFYKQDNLQEMTISNDQTTITKCLFSQQKENVKLYLCIHFFLLIMIFFKINITGWKSYYVVFME